MILARIATRNFRNLVDADWPFHNSVNLIVGDNGQGKTNVLEAIHVLGTTKSFRTSKLQNAVKLGTPELYVEGAIDNGGLRRSMSIGIGGDERRRELQLNGQKAVLGNYIRSLHLLAYSSAQLEILRGGPEWRRRFVDRGIAGVDPQHLERLNRYTRTLRQRNALLDEVRANRARASQLDVWDEELVSSAQPIIQSRRGYIAHLERAFRTVVSSLGYHVTDLAISYEPAHFAGEIERDRAVIREDRVKDMRVGFTTGGPHRDAITFSRKALPAVEMLSSGEIKMTVLFLTLAAMELYYEKFERRPLFLLDDLDAELDLGIVQRLLRYLVGSTQIFTTSAKEPLLEKIEFGPHRKFLLDAGRLKEATDC